MKLNVGVVGLGTIAQVAHLPALETLPDRFEIVHLCDASRSVLEGVANLGSESPKTSSTAADVFADDTVDVVLLLTPGAHGDLATAALEAGKHVFAEKPLCISQAELAVIRRLSKARGLTVQVGYMKSHEQVIPQAREAVARLGRPALVRSQVLHPTEDSQLTAMTLVRPAEPPPAAMLAAGAAYEADQLDLALGESPAWIRRLYVDWALGSVIHEHALMRAVIGSGFEEIHAVRSWRSPGSNDGPRHLQAIGSLASGVAFDLTWLWVPQYQEYAETLEIIAHNGGVSMALPPPYDPAGRASISVVTGPDTSFTTAGEPDLAGWAFRRQLIAFHDKISSGSALTDGLDGVKADLVALQLLVVAIAQSKGIPVHSEANAT